MVKVGDYEIHIGRKRDPQGYYVALMSVTTFEKLKDVISRLGVQFEIVGNLVFIKSKSWMNIQKIVNICHERGIRVLERKE